jgi:hypothetical protein
VDGCSKVGTKVDRKEDSVSCNNSKACLWGRNRNGDDLVGQEGKCCEIYSDRQLASSQCSW